MSAIKRFMEKVSHEMGYGGHINHVVTEEANKRLNKSIAKIETLNKIAQPNDIRGGKNEK